MDWRTWLATFTLVFLAELGDKTQLATMLLTAQTRAPLAVFLGAAAALVAGTLLAVAAGEAVARVLPLKYVKTAAGVAFIAIGVLLLRARG